MKITVICGSLRKNSLTRVLTDIAFEYARSGCHQVKYLDLGKEKLPAFEGFEADYDERVLALVKEVEETDVFIIGSPVYNGCMASAIKNLFEFVDYKVLEGSAAGFIIKAGSNISFLQVHGQLQDLMNYFRVVSNPRSVHATDEDFEGMSLKNQKIKQRIADLVDKTVGLWGKVSKKGRG
ncbi:MAG: NAD(P)H-dependent oxidoreductase [Candidatus Methanomethylicia archaeon]|nr:NAD(P)H-dependent oxidoreductase [Candidatus Methanomethylicia archaeon]